MFLKIYEDIKTKPCISGISHLKYSNLYLGFDGGYNDDVNPESVAELLVNKEIIGLIEGRMELGPRSLGARSILSDPQDNHVNWSINERLGRVEYMPFTLVIMDEYADDILVDWTKQHISSKHMTLTYQANRKWKDKLKGVIHVDGTDRPQILNENENPFYYAILKEFFKKTRIPVLINTSFNAHEEPILRTVEGGMNALSNNRIDALVAGNKLVYRNQKKIYLSGC